MTDTEITALAREYAEEIVQDTDSNPELPVCLLNEMRKEVAEDFEEKLRFMLRRYCLVEKEVVRKEYDLAEKLWIKSTCTLTEEFNRGRMNAIESLFPEIAKEVEE